MCVHERYQRKEQEMKIKTTWLILSATFLFVQPVLGGQILRKTIQAKVRESNLIVIVEVENVWSGKMSDKEHQIWHSLCSIHQVLKGDFEGSKIVVDFLLFAEGIDTSIPEPDKLLEGKKYILFLKQSGNSYTLITMHHGVLELSSEYVVFDEDLKNNIVALGKSASSINGVPSVGLSHDELLQKIKAVVEVKGEKLSTVGISRLKTSININKELSRSIRLDANNPAYSLRRTLRDEVEEVLKMKGYVGIVPAVWKDDPERRLNIYIDGLQIPEGESYVYSVEVHLRENISLMNLSGKRASSAIVWWGKSDLKTCYRDDFPEKVISDVKYYVEALIADFASHIAENPQVRKTN
jgi:hypothetical protein